LDTTSKSCGSATVTFLHCPLDPGPSTI
jgi:hypothetical protein